MDLSLTEFLDMARKWESERVKINAFMEMIHGPRAAIRLNGCNVVAQDNHIGIATDGNQYEVSLTLIPNMTFRYSEREGESAGKPILEVRTPSWRLILSE